MGGLGDNLMIIRLLQTRVKPASESLVLPVSQHWDAGDQEGKADQETASENQDPGLELNGGPLAYCAGGSGFYP